MEDWKQATKQRVVNQRGQILTVTEGQAAAIRRKREDRKAMIAAAIDRYQQADENSDPMAHVLGALEARHAHLHLALTGAWGLAEGMQLMWSLLHDEMSDMPDGVEAVTVHAGLPTPGCWTTFPGFTVAWRKAPSGIDVPYAMNTEGGEMAILNLAPCASATRQEFLDFGWGAFYPELRR